MPLPNWSKPALVEALGVETTGFGIYIHWPFCLSKCPYCDFNSHEAAQIDHALWRQSLRQELAFYAPQAAGKTVTSVFFGGGTPSLMEPATVAALLDQISDFWPVADTLEVTLEANPSTVEAGRFKDFKAAGINRLSMGIQALNDQALTFLGRKHSHREALDALAIAQACFDRFSFDLIYARPEQTAAQWEEELTRALALAGDHLSLYQLTIEDGTAFAPRYKRGEFALPPEAIQVEMFTLTQDLLAQAGLPAYEVSNHARPGSECHHNLTYWLGGDYLGIGPGAHGRLWTTATRQHRAPEIWLERVATLGHGTQERLDLTPQERAEELVMTGLRLQKGIHRGLFKMVTGVELDALINQQGLRDMVDAGFVDNGPLWLKVTDAGRLLLNAVTGKLLD